MELLFYRSEKTVTSKIQDRRHQSPKYFTVIRHNAFESSLQAGFRFSHILLLFIHVFKRHDLVKKGYC